MGSGTESGKPGETWASSSNQNWLHTQECGGGRVHGSPLPGPWTILPQRILESCAPHLRATDPLLTLRRLLPRVPESRAPVLHRPPGLRSCRQTPCPCRAALPGTQSTRICVPRKPLLTSPALPLPLRLGSTCPFSLNQAEECSKRSSTLPPAELCSAPPRSPHHPA